MMTITKRNGTSFKVTLVRFTMFDERIAGSYVQFTYVKDNGHIGIGSCLKDDIESISCAACFAQDINDTDTKSTDRAPAQKHKNQKQT